MGIFTKSKYCPVCKGKSPSPWRSLLYLIDGSIVYSSPLVFKLNEGKRRVLTTELITQAFTPTTFYIFRAKDEQISKKLDGHVEIAGGYRYWEWEETMGCYACDGDHTAEAAMRRKLEGLW